MSTIRPIQPRRLIAEYLGTLLLVVAVVGSGIMAVTLSPDDVGLQLLENSIATMLALAVLILILGPVSGAHFNPVVTLADWWLHRRDDDTIGLAEVVGYVGAQVLGAISGAVLANLMFGLDAVSWSVTARTTPHLWIGETVATGGLILLIFGLVRTHRTRYAPAAVGAYIGAAYWFTSSTSFANPAVTVGRAFTDTFAGISPASVLAFIAFQIIGAIAGLALVAVLYPRPQTVTGDIATIEPATTSERVPARSRT
ncbi:arsenate reductase [Hamadaea flava]|uniref:MIP/aquaporin family protein n=1 Tax=Hamadaea flava TaxID=1742688 RepID=A0ABV8LNJ2_9ACTN|nr:MIP/aquaporin family protein [Hamadaea flava]MCP2323283.1 arsenate reductase [Hamadaea flava]